MKVKSDRLDRERYTITVMIELYCRDHHHTKAGLCPQCQDLLPYAMQRIDKCPFGDKKPTCAQCPIHCYKPVMREHIRAVMRYAGPRMLIYHPKLAIMHFLDRKARLVRGKD